MYRPNSKYPKTWNKYRFYRFKQCDYICQMCLEYNKDNLVLHHIIPIGCGGSHYWENLVVLCRGCHDIVHSKTYKGPFLKLRRKKK